MKALRFFIIPVIIIISISAGLYLYNLSLRAELSASACRTLNELMQQQRLTFLSQLEGEMAVVDTISELITSIEPISGDTASRLTFLRDAADKSRFKYMILSDLDGRAITSENLELDISGRDYFLKAKAGLTFVSDPLISMVDGTTIVVISSPIMIDGKISAVIAGAYVTSELEDLFFTSFAGEGYAYITDANGDVITRAKHQRNGVQNNVLGFYSTVEVAEKDDYNTIIQRMKAGEQGHTVYLYNGNRVLMHYSPLGMNGWYIFASVPENVISAETGYLMKLSFMLMVTVIIVLTVLFAYIIIIERRHSRILHNKAYFNSLTGAPNLVKFKEDASLLLKENRERPYTAIRLSIEGLDFLNEIFSFAVGDIIIKTVAEALAVITDKKTECFGHIYGDRFIILLNCDSFEASQRRRLQFEEVFIKRLDGLISYKVKFSSGVYVLEPGETDIQSVLEKVSFAHHTAKQSKHLDEKIREYDSKLKEALKLEREIEAKMEEALRNREFTMFLQPKYLLLDESIVGAEALARWWVNGQYIMHPADFIPIFEKNGFVVFLDMYMFEEACKFVNNLIKTGRTPITVSVNFSRLHLLKQGFVDRLCDIADKYHVPHKLLEVEITESSMVGNELLLKNVLNELHSADFTLSMDDFGSGYSSLGLLKEIPIDVVKIDRSFFENSENIEREHIVISSVIDMAKKLGIHTVAEGVETREHIDFLKSLGCEIVQGYYYAKPMPFMEFENKHLQ